MSIIGDQLNIKLRGNAAVGFKQNFSEATKFFRSTATHGAMNRLSSNLVQNLRKNSYDEEYSERITLLKKIDDFFSFVEFNNFYPRQEFARGQQ